MLYNFLVVSYYIALTKFYIDKEIFHKSILSMLCLILQFIMIREKKESKTEYMLQYFLPRIEHFFHFEIMKYLDTSVRT